MAKEPDGTAEGERYGDRLFHSGAEQELDRLLALAAAFDSASHARLSDIGVGPGWRCLDVGAGPGTIARWLAARGCEVVAVDRDTRFLDQAKHHGVRVIEADVLDETFDPGTFDLVHTRFMLMHLRRRDWLLPRLAGWVRPGGWLAVSDSADLGTASSPHPIYRRVMAALWQALAQTIGTDINHGRRYPAAVAACGLTDVDAAVDLPPTAAGSPMAAFWRLSIDQCRPLIIATGLADGAAIDQALDYLTTPGTWELSLAMITCWGRKSPPHLRA